MANQAPLYISQYLKKDIHQVYLDHFFTNLFSQSINYYFFVINNEKLHVLFLIVSKTWVCYPFNILFQ